MKALGCMVGLEEMGELEGKGDREDQGKGYPEKHTVILQGKITMIYPTTVLTK